MVHMGVAVLAIMCSVSYALTEVALYPGQFEDGDIQAFIRNRTLLQQSFDCVMYHKPCPIPEAIYWKDNIDRVCENDCEKCSEKEKEVYDAVKAWYLENEPETWKHALETVRARGECLKAVKSVQQKC